MRKEDVAAMQRARDGARYTQRIIRAREARLIAAAPDLLDALKLCVPFCRGHQETPEKRARYLQIIKAIAKAEGKSAKEEWGDPTLTEDQAAEMLRKEQS